MGLLRGEHGPCTAQVVLAQAVHVCGDAAEDFVGQASALGWGVVLGEAVPSEAGAGCVGGVAILVRRGYVAVERRAVPVGCEGRASVASVVVATGEEVVFCSVYLVTDQGLSEGNKGLL